MPFPLVMHVQQYSGVQRATVAHTFGVPTLDGRSRTPPIGFRLVALHLSESGDLRCGHNGQRRSRAPVNGGPAGWLSSLMLGDGSFQ
jgi:hypothetical protein